MLLLDEVGDLSPHAQASLLRFLQEREVRPVGSVAAHRVDVRLIAATNKPLQHAMALGEFRAHLDGRLGEIVLEVPPLRARVDDVPLLVRHFPARCAARHGRAKPPELAPEVWDLIQGHPWPGNVRELERAVNRAVILGDTGLIDMPYLGLHRALIPAMLNERQREAISIARRWGGAPRRPHAEVPCIEGRGAARPPGARRNRLPPPTGCGARSQVRLGVADSGLWSAATARPGGDRALGDRRLGMAAAAVGGRAVGCRAGAQSLKVDSACRGTESVHLDSFTRFAPRSWLRSRRVPGREIVHL